MFASTTLRAFNAATGVWDLVELVIDCPMTGHGRNVCASVRVNADS